MFLFAPFVVKFQLPRKAFLAIIARFESARIPYGTLHYLAIRLHQYRSDFCVEKLIDPVLDTKRSHKLIGTFSVRCIFFCGSAGFYCIDPHV